MIAAKCFKQLVQERVMVYSLGADLPVLVRVQSDSYILLFVLAFLMLVIEVNTWYNILN